MSSGVTNLNEISRLLSTFAAEAQKDSEEVARLFMLDVARNTINFTRVDKGRLVNGFVFSENEPSNFTPPESLKKADPTSTKSSKVAALTSQILKQNKNAKILYFVNNVKYAKYREFGTPSQEPDFMLARGIQKAKMNLSRRIREVRNDS